MKLIVITKIHKTNYSNYNNNKKHHPFIKIKMNNTKF